VSAREAVLDAEGAAAPPRRNGELVFSAPWESRAFGMALALCERGLFEWEEFRQRLIREIALAEREAARAAATFSYYGCWLRALEGLLVAKGCASPDELDARAHRLAALPAGHDH
jgi:nitrile hydratase accessory protein